jgi:hypothetical protein
MSAPTESQETNENSGDDGLHYTKKATDALLEDINKTVNDIGEDLHTTKNDLYPFIEGTKNRVIEQGTSGIWHYRKWEDGTAECWGGEANNLLFNQSMQGGTHWKCANIRQTFPTDSSGNALFKSYTYVGITPMYYSSGDIKTAQVLGVSASAQYVDYFVERKASAAATSATSVTVYFEVKGTWEQRSNQ